MNNDSIIYGKLCSQYYDIKEQYAIAQEVDFYTSFMKPTNRVLEAMCGSGRLQIPLIQRGYTVDGIDRSPSMLKRCRERCARLNLTPLLYEQSLETMKIDHTYNIAIIAMGSFQLIADKAIALQALKKIHAHMDDNAYLFIDIFTPEATNHNQRSTSIARIDNHHVIRFSVRYMFDKQEKKVDAFCLYELLINGIVQARENELMHFTWYADDELNKLLNQAGFETITIHEKLFRSDGLSRILQAKALPLI